MSINRRDFIKRTAVASAVTAVGMNMPLELEIDNIARSEKKYAVCTLVTRANDYREMLAQENRKTSLMLRNEVDEKIDRAGRPACLEDIGVGSFTEKSDYGIFGEKFITKKVTVFTEPICKRRR